MKARFSSLQVTQTIDWEAAETAMNQLPLAKQQWVSKLAAKFTGWKEHATLGTTGSCQMPML